MEEKQSSEGVTEPPRTAAMLSTCLSRSCVGVTPATYLTSYWPGCASHLVLLSSLLAGDPNKVHLTGKRAMPGDRAVLWMKPSLMTHPSICDPAQMLVNLTAGSVTGAVALLTLIKHTFTPGKQHKGKRCFLLKDRKLTPTQVMITSPKWSLCYTNINQLLHGLNHSTQPTNLPLTLLSSPKLFLQIYSLRCEFNTFKVVKVDRSKLKTHVIHQTKRQVKSSPLVWSSGSSQIWMTLSHCHH